MNVSANSSLNGSTGVTQADAPGVYSPRAPRTGTVEDSTKLSADSVQAQQLKDSLSRLPDTRSDRVAAARQSLQNGTQPSSAQVAGAIAREYGNDVDHDGDSK